MQTINPIIPASYDYLFDIVAEKLFAEYLVRYILFDEKPITTPALWQDAVIYIRFRQRDVWALSEEQIKNLAIITRLYDGDTQAFADLVDEYKIELANAPETAENKDTKIKSYWQSQVDWLLERFPDGEYRDVIGLCKAAPLKGEDGIEDQDYSLNAGRYVGVVIEDDGMTEEEFKVEMLSLNEELSKLNAEAISLESKISDNLKELLGVK